MIYYQNKNYKVETIDPEGDTKEGTGYKIVNLVTGQVERREGLLPVALSLAVDLDKALDEFAEAEGKAKQRVLTPAQDILVPRH